MMHPGLTSSGAVRPDKFLHRIAWNRSWENDLLKVSNEPCSVEGCLRVELVYKSMGEDPRPILDSQNESICRVQNDIRNYAIQKLAVDGLEERWRSIAYDARRELILEAFFRTSCVSPSLEDARRWCPDMTIDNVSAKNGQLFLDLLQLFVTESPNDKPISLPHPCVNNYYKNNPRLAPLQLFIESQRSYFVSMVVWRILLALHNDDETYTTVRPDKIPGWKSALSQIEKIFGKEFKDTVKLSSKVFNQKQEECVDICICCQKPPSLLAPGSQLMNCATCKKAGRTSRYCSKECQRKDWKSGRHKKICGKALFTLQDDEEAPLQDTHGKIPVSDPSFKKSPTLLHQINRLKDPRHPDYVYMQPGDLGDIAFTFQEIPTRMFFLVMRRRALYNGNKCAVKTMFVFLCQILETRPECSRDKLKLQLEREYGFNVDDVDGDIDPPTEEETDWAGKLLMSFMKSNDEL